MRIRQAVRSELDTRLADACLMRSTISVLENCVGSSHNSGPRTDAPIKSLRGAERRSNLDFGRLEIASGFALAMTIFQSFRVIYAYITLENPCIARSRFQGMHPNVNGRPLDRDKSRP